MQYRDFCGRKSAVVALGTMDFGGKIEEGRARDYMDAYCEIGGNFIDTARVYGDFVRRIQGGSEKVIGRWMEDNHKRDDIILSTKGAHPPFENMHAPRLKREEIRSDLAMSLDNLRTDHVDIYWLHRDDERREVREILETLTELTEDGTVRYVGVSNWRTERIREALDCAEKHGLVRLHANQPQFSLARQTVVEDDTLVQIDGEGWRMHCETGLICVPFSSQAKGFLTKMDAKGEAALADKVSRRFLCSENLEVLKRAQALSKETGLSVNTLALAWLFAQPFTTLPIAGVSSLEHIEAIRVACEAQITAEQRDRLRKM